MSELKKIYKRIAEIEQDNQAEASRIEKLKAGCKKALADASAVLEVTDDPAEYKAAQEAIKDNKTAIELYNRKLDKLNRRLDPAEASAACDVLKQEFDAEQQKTAVACFELLNTINDMLRELERKGDEMETAGRKLQSFAGVSFSNMKRIININLSNQIDNDERNAWRYFINDFYTRQRGRDALCRDRGLRV